MRELTFVQETPEMYASKAMKSYIQQEISNPRKEWILDIVNGRREQRKVKLCTPEFVLVPTFVQPHPPRHSKAFHWLAVVTDERLRTLRDLEGRHVLMLIDLYKLACLQIKAETGIDPELIEVYVHYPPSVYRLHVHFAFPKQLCAQPPGRMHPLAKIISTLAADSEYYSKCSLEVPVFTDTELYEVYCSQANLN